MLFFCRFAIYRLTKEGSSIRSWRSYFIVFSSSPTQKNNVIEFANLITKGKGFLTMSSIVSSDRFDHEKVEQLEKLIYENLNKRKVQSLVEVGLAKDSFDGIKEITTNYGLGPITPNTIIIGLSTEEDNFEKIAKLIQLGEKLGRNIILYKEVNETRRDSIDLWWDDKHKRNSELMIVLSHMLRRTSIWKKCFITLKCLASNEDGREGRIEYLEEFFFT